MANANSTRTRKSSTKPPAFQWYPKDFLTDENVRVMSLQERGAYITLISLCWLEGTLPADSGRLAKLCGSTAAAFRRIWPAIEPCFQVHAERPDRLIHQRLERERQVQAAWRAKSSKGGKVKRDKAGATPLPIGKGGTPVVATIHEPQPCSSSSSSSSSSSASSSLKDTHPARLNAPMVSMREHRSHALCGVVCMPSGLFGELVRKCGGPDPEARVSAWYRQVCAEWQIRVDRGETIGDDNFEFLRNRWKESNPTLTPTKGKQELAAEAALARFTGQDQP